PPTTPPPPRPPPFPYTTLFRSPGLPPVRHLLARHEQAAAFMADGQARATGRPGVCLAVCGPGVFNAFTPLATAFTDSVPVLLIRDRKSTRLNSSHVSISYAVFC